MDVLSKRRTDCASGVVVRQFSPSRIEREVLVQVFALIGGHGAEAAETQFATRSAAAPHHAEDDEQRTEACTAGRFVA